MASGKAASPHLARPPESLHWRIYTQLIPKMLAEGIILAERLVMRVLKDRPHERVQSADRCWGVKETRVSQDVPSALSGRLSPRHQGAGLPRSGCSQPAPLHPTFPAHSPARAFYY